jgi:hypothetical protein
LQSYQAISRVFTSSAAEKLISDAARRIAQGLTVMSHYDQALELLRADINRLEPGRGNGSSAYLSLYGMLFCMAAIVAARAYKPASGYPRSGALITISMLPRATVLLVTTTTP